MERDNDEVPLLTSEDLHWIDNARPGDAELERQARALRMAKATRDALREAGTDWEEEGGKITRRFYYRGRRGLGTRTYPYASGAGRSLRRWPIYNNRLKVIAWRYTRNRNEAMEGHTREARLGMERWRASEQRRHARRVARIADWSERMIARGQRRRETRMRANPRPWRAGYGTRSDISF